MALLQPGSAANAQTGEVIRRIVVEGNQRIEPSTVESYLAIRAGEPYDPREGRRFDQEPVRHRPVRRRDHRGAGRRDWWSRWSRIRSSIASPSRATSGSRPAVLEAEIQLRPRVVYTRSRVQNAVNRILELYRRNGRYAAKVEPKIIELDQNRVDLVFEISEGPTTGVGGITFIGNEAVQRQHAARRDPDARERLVPLPELRRHLRPRSGVVRRGVAAPVLQCPRLRRFPGRLDRGRADAGRQGVLHHLHARGGSADTSSARSRSRRRSRICGTEQLIALAETARGDVYNADQVEGDDPGAHRRDRPARLRLRRHPAAAAKERRER